MNINEHKWTQSDEIICPPSSHKKHRPAPHCLRNPRLQTGLGSRARHQRPHAAGDPGAGQLGATGEATGEAIGEAGEAAAAWILPRLPSGYVKIAIENGHL